MKFTPGDELASGIMSALSNREVPEPTIDERDAVICWGWHDDDDGGNGDEVTAQRDDWSDVRVFDRHVVQSGRGGEDARIYAAAMCTTGSIEAGWLGNSGRTCQGAFSRALYDGSMPNGSAYVDVLLQFAKVRECDWARFMLAALYASSIMDVDESDLIHAAD